eukprot:TRINITY_DN8337_c0_g1_i1.p1 TRINITY_DN8337_c0_g1~~TRINITY_DN8337_c0_g1_i1.p1  ORF type:complete len:907 (+),score=227.97 TRINITY_DN8337_c0_g1_i1:74-2722(+)
MAEIGLFSRDAWDFWLEFGILYHIVKNLPQTFTRSAEALRVLQIAMDTADPLKPATWKQARAEMEKFLQTPNSDHVHQVTAVGHCHIDTAWLWRYQETRRKCIRSWSTAVTYMQDYPWYVFIASQAQQYEWVKEDAPSLFKQMQDMQKKGQFVVIGGSWIEMDANVPSGESFARQFLYGQRLFQKEFGVTCDTFWLPDTFGYSPQLPQICRLSGMVNFMSQKLSWNLINKFPHHSFIWEGLDGSQVLTHFPPSNTYNGHGSANELFKSVNDYQQRAVSKQSLLVYGHGDGGGGPTREMIERLDKLKNTDQLPRVQCKDPSVFFAELRDNSKNLPVWVGELYFELHRGTYTTQALLKKLNRQSEQKLKILELWSVIASKVSDFQYPSEKIARVWKNVLLNQFHDVITGSCIKDVALDAEKIYKEGLAQVEDLLSHVIRALSGEVFSSPKKKQKTDVQMTHYFLNALGWDRYDVVHLENSAVCEQKSHDGKPIVLAMSPSMGLGHIVSKNPFSPVTLKEDAKSKTISLDNQFVHYVLSHSGIVTSIKLRDQKTGLLSRELASGSCNAFVLFEDIPLYWDAWDVELYHLQKFNLIGNAFEYSVIETGPLRSTIQFKWKISETSSILQQVSLSCCSARLDFVTHVTWKEKHKFLKVEFPLAIKSEEATYEVPFGFLARPTHFNTTQDIARFEVCGHRWADLAEYGVGVALLNDSKYGYACHRHILRLSLLRSPTKPDATADHGTHELTYSLLPHYGSFQESRVVQQAHQLNSPVVHMEAAEGIFKKWDSVVRLDGGSPAFFHVDSPNVIIETVKLSEDSEDCIVVRLYEAFGSHCEVCLHSAFHVNRCESTDILEQNVFEEIMVQEGSKITLTFNPLQVVTLKLHL